MKTLRVVNQKKLELRASFRRVRTDFVKTENRETNEGLICDHLKPLLQTSNRKIGASYIGHLSEVNLKELRTILSDWKWVYPRMHGEELRFYSTGNDEADWEVHAVGIKEPCLARAKVVDLAACSVVLVPGVAFDKSGRRLGSGKGYYDRALANYKGLCVGVAFSVQVFHGNLPAESHDRKMDYLVTEAGLCPCSET